ncbi:precorrin-6y C5,15-methyltransferase (decarboxylating) subunit CbiE [Stutzerimonas zhaodongensis]|uniref:precorrin-6y C5,15-methyltransferase (decarboxylating) subunit CbiE n=1 Tax=Stutzerimonas TaxID=2901164 RepID=UPI00388FCB3A
MTPWLTVVGIGEDGWAGLGEAARQALGEASRIIGSERQLALLLDQLQSRGEAWPSPFSLQPVMSRRGTPLCVLASGDPMFYGIGATLARQLNPEEMRVFSAPSSVSLAAARLGWPLQEVEVVSLVARPLAALNSRIFRGTRLLILSNDGTSPAQVAQLLTSRGFGASRLTALEHLGGERERRVDSLAAEWSFGAIADLNLLAVECIADSDVACVPLTPGLADHFYRHDGQLTKRDVRAVTLARLAPMPGELLWDVGAGCGSIGIEWMRAHPSCRAIAVEADAGRQALIEHNRDALGVPALKLVAGRAPEALAGLPAPDAIFIGGGVTVAGVMEQCWASLKPGGRLLANAVTLQSEAMLMSWRERIGGELTRLSVAHAQPLGGFDTWRGALPITLLQVEKPR